MNWIRVRVLIYGNDVVGGERTIEAEYDALIDADRFEIIEDCGDKCRLFRAWDDEKQGLTVEHTLDEMQDKLALALLPAELTESEEE